MRRSTVIQLLALLCCVAMLYGAATRIPTINGGRAQLNILGSESPLANTPPEYVFYIQAFGAFRGLIADIAFLRAERLKEQGRFYDAMQLHKWICTLQPHFPTVWEYAAWNMAWNISVTTFTPQERWNWVYNGVKLLRDQGIPFNPRAVNLYKQLAWIFNNKMSETTDEYHFAYKANWAWRMHLLLGPAPDPLAGLDPANLADQLKSPGDLDLLEQAGRKTFVAHEEERRRTAAARGEEFKPRELPETGGSEGGITPFRVAQRAAAEPLRAILEAAPTLKELYARHPETRRVVGKLQALGIQISDEELTEDEYWRDQGLAQAFFRPYRELTSARPLLTSVAREQPTSYQQAARAANLDQILGVRKGDPVGEALLRFLQRKVLQEVYKLDPAHMLYVVENFGPVDWRSVDAHSLYWVTKGLITASEGPSSVASDKANTARIIFFSLRNLFLRNHIVFEPDPENIHLSYLNLSRDLNFIEPLNQAYIKYGPLFDPRGGEGPGVGDIFRAGHINFITEAIRALYLSGREAEAAHYYRYLKDTYPTAPGGEPNPLFDKSLQDFVLASFLEGIEIPGAREIRIAIEGFLTSAYSHLANGDLQTYLRLVRSAREYHDNYVRDKRGALGWSRQQIPEFLDMQVDTFGAWLSLPAVTPVQTLHKVQLWRRAPLYLRQGVYDDLLPRLKSECDAWNFDVAKAFPEPQGMEEYRAAQPPRTRSPAGEFGETPTQAPG